MADEALRALKRQLKDFESSYREQHGRVPRRADIVSAGMMPLYDEYRHRRGQMPGHASPTRSTATAAPETPAGTVFPVAAATSPASVGTPATPFAIQGSPVKRVRSLFSAHPDLRGSKAVRVLDLFGGDDRDMHSAAPPTPSPAVPSLSDAHVGSTAVLDDADDALPSLFVAGAGARVRSMRSTLASSMTATIDAAVPDSTAADAAASTADMADPPTQSKQTQDDDDDEDEMSRPIPLIHRVKPRKRPKHGTRRRPLRHRDDGGDDRGAVRRLPSAAVASKKTAAKAPRSATDHDAFAFDDNEDEDEDDIVPSAPSSASSSASSSSAGAAQSVPRSPVGLKRKRRGERDGAAAKRARSQSSAAPAGGKRSMAALQRALGTNLVAYQLGNRRGGFGRRMGNGGGGGGGWSAPRVGRSNSAAAAAFGGHDGADAFSLLPDLLDMGNMTLDDAMAAEAAAAAASLLFAPVDVTDDELFDSLEELVGARSFRAGQEAVVRRLLCCASSLLLTTTGGGKSLCYQLPTLLAKRRARGDGRPLTIVVSPLLALMDDQLAHLPPALDGACLNSLQPAAARAKTIELLCAGRLDVLFVSPEKLTGPLFGRLIAERRLPPVRLLCIDEIHCASEWSHNFRPAYMRLARVVCDDLRPACILGLSATVTRDCQRALCELFRLPEEGVVRARVLPTNIRLTVTRENDKLRALVSLLQSPPFASLASILVYCLRQGDADDVAEYLRSRSIDASSYHAGKSRDHRAEIQARFMDGKVRVLVATTAFGMGVNKADVRAVIHYALPRSVEALVQEAGRAGRDGEAAHCRVFLDQDDIDALRSLTHVGVVERASIDELLRAAAVAVGNAYAGAGETFALLPISDTLRASDLLRETADTLLAYLEAHCDGRARILPPACRTAIVTVFRPDEFEALADEQRPPVVDHILARASVKTQRVGGLRVRYGGLSSSAARTRNVYRVDLFRAAEALTIGVDAVVAQLAHLRFRRFIQFELTDECFVLRLRDGAAAAAAALSNGEAADALMERVAEAQQTAALKLRAVVALLSESADRKLPVDAHDDALAKHIDRYFEGEAGARAVAATPLDVRGKVLLTADVRVFIGGCDEETRAALTPLAVARIFHGMASPQFPAAKWQRNPFWGRHVHVDFEVVQQTAARILAAE